MNAAAREAFRATVMRDARCKVCGGSLADKRRGTRCCGPSCRRIGFVWTPERVAAYRAARRSDEVA